MPKPKLASRPFVMPPICMKPIDSVIASLVPIDTAYGMLNLYVDPLLTDEKAADEIWELWDSGVISDDLAALAWLGIAVIGEPHYPTL